MRNLRMLDTFLALQPTEVLEPRCRAIFFIYLFSYEAIFWCVYFSRIRFRGCVICWCFCFLLTDFLMLLVLQSRGRFLYLLLFLLFLFLARSQDPVDTLNSFGWGVFIDVFQVSEFCLARCFSSSQSRICWMPTLFSQCRWLMLLLLVLILLIRIWLFFFLFALWVLCFVVRDFGQIQSLVLWAFLNSFFSARLPCWGFLSWVFHFSPLFQPLLKCLAPRCLTVFCFCFCFCIFRTEAFLDAYLFFYLGFFFLLRFYRLWHLLMLFAPSMIF